MTNLKTALVGIGLLASVLMPFQQAQAQVQSQAQAQAQARTYCLYLPDPILCVQLPF
ncbi:MAG TPA: hypothetical protein VGM81_20840 [Burkholderiaceae bacterium]|jgi:hypothetical protein